MRAVKREHTGPEMVVRRTLHNLGLRFRLHQKVLPGTPDIVLAKYNMAIFVHGCFWHRHINCSKASTPKTREQFWKQKFARNIQRDQEKERALKNVGWRVLTIWECETYESSALRERLRDEFGLN